MSNYYPLKRSKSFKSLVEWHMKAILDLFFPSVL